jgi:cell division protein FtsW (lipid II flippase)
MRKINGPAAFLQSPVGIVLTINAVWLIVVWLANIPFNYLVSILLIVADIFIAFYLLDRLVYFFSFQFKTLNIGKRSIHA